MTEGRLAPDEVRTRTFTRAVRGYKRRDVRRLLERVAADLARLHNGQAGNGPDDQLPLTPEEIEEARFQPSLGGYEMDEVDEFLDQLVAELERAAHESPRSTSALPAPPRPGLFPPAHGYRPAGLAEGQDEAAGREAEPPDPADAGLIAGPRTEPGPGTQPPIVPRPSPGVEPPIVPRPAPAAGPLPAAQPPPIDPASAARPRPRPSAGPPLPEPAVAAGVQPAAPPAGPDEGFFPPPSVPPSAAPAPPPPPPPAQRPPTLSPNRPLTPSEVETRSFERGAPGYLPTHVDLFLARAARALAGRDGETLTRWDVLRQRFPLGPRGYATSEVDAFLVRLAAQFPDPDPATQEEILRKLQGRADGP